MGTNSPLTAEEMQVWYGEFYEQGSRQNLNAANVPEGLRQLLPYAAFWGISDDWTREDLVAAAPEDVKRNLASLVNRFDDQFDDWLAGPEADSPPFSREYIAFTALRMAADMAE